MTEPYGEWTDEQAEQFALDRDLLSQGGPSRGESIAAVKAIARKAVERWGHVRACGCVPGQPLPCRQPPCNFPSAHESFRDPRCHKEAK